MAGGGDGGEGNDDREKDDWERRKRTKEEEEEEEQRRKGWMNKALGVLRPPLPEPFHVKEPLTPPEKARRGANRWVGELVGGVMSGWGDEWVG